MKCQRFAKTVDPNIPNSEMEWLFRPNFTDPATGLRFLKGGIVCTGIMMRVTDRHPYDLGYWWTGDPSYAKAWAMSVFKVDPSQPLCQTSSACRLAGWTRKRTVLRTYTKSSFNPDGVFAQLVGDTVDLGESWLAPLPFGQGHMRVAWYVLTERGILVAKRYNSETMKHITDGLGETEEDAINRDVRTYMQASKLAMSWNVDIVPHLKFQNYESFSERDVQRIRELFRIQFVEPFALQLNGTWYFAERLIKGSWVKWNSNTGEKNLSEQATAGNCHEIADAFGHYTYDKTYGQMMVVDLQGCDTPENKCVTYTDPQIHTRSFSASSTSRKTDPLYKLFSVGNLGCTGMYRFFANHRCTGPCDGFRVPIRQRLASGCSPTFAPSARSLD
eukprot:TRINITY_DN26615_c0_g1_i2.p1 TRINITY_DN26615_c0_g1~~TRINITY_DN26615_c0_g1_i2.p1  ORF type:complete len:388 (+),score=41.38 TRINITY_DN26615_c0_g1_i2:211-1374(+)